MKRIYLVFLATFFGLWSLSAQKPISQADWVLVEVDSEELTGEGTNNGHAIHSFDGDLGTFWHTDWSTTGDPFPHFITIDLGKSYDMIGFQFDPRAGNTGGVPDTMSFWTSVDNVTWDSVAGGLWDAPYDVQRTEAFTSTGRYIKLVGESGQGDNLHMMCAELNVLVLGADFEADKTTIMRGESVTFTDKSGNTPVAWEWIFEGGTPATSTDQNPTVTYAAAGNYDVTLISKPDAGDDSLNDTLTMTDYITADIPNISQADWTVVYANSTFGTQVAANVFDGDPSTIWHSDWQAADPFPHTIILDLGATYDMEGFSYTPRAAGGNGTVDEYQFFVTKDLPSDEIDESWGTPVSAGAWISPWDVVRSEFFTSSKIGRYVIFYMLSEKTDAVYASCAEINVKGSLYGAAFTANKTEIYATQTIDFMDLSSGVPAAHAWTFEGGTPATSADMNPTVKYDAGGVFDVELVMTPQSGVGDNDTLLKADYINVKATPVAKSLAKDAWKVIYFDSEETGAEDTPAVKAIDGDPSTLWHTAWSAGEDPYPHSIIIDLGSNTDMVGFEYVPRSGGGNGTVAQYEFLTSIDAEVYTLADSSTWADNWAETRTEMFDAPATGRFIKFVAKSEKAGNPWASCAELNVLVAITGAEFGSSTTFTEKGGAVDFIDFSAGDPTGWQWTFEGGTPASSTEQSPSGIVYDAMGTFDVTLTTTGGTAPGTLEKTDFIEVNYMIPSVGSGAYIDTVEVGKVLANYTGSDGGYVDYLDMEVELYRGESYSLKVTHVDPWYGGILYQYVWIDWDGDGVYGDEELLLNALDPTSFTVPAGAPLGNTRMRVIGRYYDGSDDPYKNISYGEIEEYTIVIADLAAEVPVADFESDVTSTCAGVEVQYTDLSTNTPTGWAWTFEGGTPATSDLKNPVVVYATGGVYDASLTATQTSGSDDEAKTDYMTVNDAPAVSAGDDVSSCFGEAITLSGAGAVTYEWDNDVMDGVAFIPATMSYVVTGTDAMGCSATDTVDVTVAAKIDFTVTESATSLLVEAAAGITFQWIDCADNSAVDGATAGLFEPVANGSYAVVVDDGTCTDTSDCYAITGVGIDQNGLSGAVKIYPNPSHGLVHVTLDRDNATIKVYDVLGSLILVKEHSAANEQIQLHDAGLYFIQIESEGEIYMGKLIIE